MRIVTNTETTTLAWIQAAKSCSLGTIKPSATRHIFIFVRGKMTLGVFRLILEWSMKSHINSLVNLYYSGMQKSNMMIAVFDLTGGLIFATDKFAQLFGKVYFNNRLESTMYQQMEENQPHLVDKLVEIRKRVVDTKEEYQYLLNLHLHNGIHSYRVTTYPVFAPDGSVIATEIRCKVFYWFPFNQLLKDGLCEKPKLSSKHIKLTSRQKQIIFYLILGYPQQTIAEMIGISRGTIAKMIAEDICPKFNLPGTSATVLVKTITQYDYEYLIPNGIISMPKLIMIN